MTYFTSISSPGRAALLCALLLAGCTAKVAAPVSERTAAESASAATAKPGHHLVRSGETLYRIAQQYGVSVRDLSEWNRLTDPNQLEVGRELRVVPPEGVQIQPIVTQTPVELAPLAKPGAPTPLAPLAPATAGSGAPEVKHGPKGGVQPYSDQAWAAAQAAAGVSAPAPDPKPAAAPEESAPAVPAAGVVRAVEGVEWSWPSAGKLVGKFSESSTRKGLEISGKLGDPVLAAASGKIVYAGTGLRGYGKLVIIKHDANFLSAYAHNDQLLVKEGDSVSKGQQIAKLGSTDSDRPKLHFEIRRQGKPVDPSQYLPVR